MKVTAHDDYLLLQRYTPKKKGDFIDNTGSTQSPIFVVVSVDDPSSDFEKGDLVVPRPDRLIQTIVDGEQYFYCQENDIMGTAEEDSE